MIINKTYKFRLYPSEETTNVLKQHCGNVRFLWNKLVELNNQLRKEKKGFLNQCELSKKIVEIKNEYDFLKLAHSQPLQVNMTRLYDTNRKALKPVTIQARKQKIAQTIAQKTLKEQKYPNYNHKKAMQRAFSYGFPNFHSKLKGNDSLYYPQNFKIARSRVFVAKVGWIDMKQSQKLEGKAKCLSIIQDGDQWYVSIVCEINRKDKIKPNLEDANLVGIDVGIKTFAYCSDGTKHNHNEIQKELKHIDKRISKKQRSISKKQNVKKERNGQEITVYSCNKQKEIRTLQKLNRRKRNIKNDFLHKLSHYVIAKYDGIILEDLAIKELIEKNTKEQNKQMVKEIHLASWYTFVQMLQYKALWNYKYFHKTNQYLASTQLCSRCGNKKKMKLSDRIYKCDKCGLEIDRDLNASLNIVKAGRKELQKLFQKKTVPMERGDLYKIKGVDIDTLSEYERSSNISKVA